MANLDFLAQSIYDWHKSRQEDWRRDHLGASIIGGQCERAIWYAWRWCKAPDHEGRLLRLFETGQLAEDRLVKELQGIGIEVTRRQDSFQFCNGHGGGSIDGAGQGFRESGAHHILEFKTHSQSSWADLVAKGVQKSKPQHYIQMTIYMGLSGIDRSYYIAVNKNTDEIYTERIKLDRLLFDEVMNKADRIVSATMPPDRMTTNPAFYVCKMCQFASICHAKGIPEINCRTCCHSSPANNGKWKCYFGGQFIDSASQRQACKNHIWIPQLLNQQPIDAGDDFIKYETWTNGPRHIKSVDYA
jgi:CRISPR/Cas system-associated exonuclease Cas4 (RecB family)